MNLEFLESYVEAFSRQVEPSDAQRRSAASSQRALRASLDSGNMASRIVGDFLSGSYARHTAIAPIDDVDIVFLIDPAKWKRPLFRSLPEPGRILQTFAEAIRLRRDTSRVETQRRSVGLKMSKLDIDAVPAVVDTREGFIRIPDRKKDDWILTAPRLHSEIASSLNQRRDRLLKPLVKVLKAWNAGLDDDARLKSFTIETMVVRLFMSTDLGSIFAGALKFFDFLCGQFSEETHFDWRVDVGIRLKWFSWSYELLDVAGTGSNLLANLSEERRERFLAAGLAARDLIMRAKAARSEVRAVEYLASVFPL